MSETIPQPPKPFSKTSYVLLTTLWAFLLPGAVIYIPLILLIAVGLLMFPRGFGDARSTVHMVICIACIMICAAAFFAFLLY